MLGFCYNYLNSTCQAKPTKSTPKETKKLRETARISNLKRACQDEDVPSEGEELLSHDNANMVSTS